MGGEEPVSATQHPRRARRRGLASAAGAAALLATAGCGIESTGVQVVGAQPVAQGVGVLPGGGPSGGAYTYYLYFFQNGHLASTKRSATAQADQQTILDAVIQGPTKAELAQGYTSEIPTGLKVVDLTAQGEAWLYQFSDELTMEERAQVVCSIQANLQAPSVGTVYGENKPTWYICSDDFQDLGAPAYLLNSSQESATPSAVTDGASPAQ